MNYQNNPANATNAYIGGNTAFSVGPAYPTVCISPLDEVSKGLESALATIRNHAGRVRAVADTLFGCLPEGKEGGNTSPQRMGRIGGLNDQSDAINSALYELEQQINRLAPVS